MTATREANRARFPWIAEITDRLGPDCKLVWAQDAQGEIGKRPVLAKNEMEISAEMRVALEDHYRVYRIGPYAEKRK